MGLSISSNTNILNVTSLPLVGKPGQIIFNLSDAIFYGWDGSNWVVMGSSSGGGGISDARYFHNQTSPQLEWIITHNLGKHPSVQAFDSSNEQIHGLNVFHISTNQLKIILGVAITGFAYLN